MSQSMCPLSKYAHFPRIIVGERRHRGRGERVKMCLGTNAMCQCWWHLPVPLAKRPECAYYIRRRSEEAHSPLLSAPTLNSLTLPSTSCCASQKGKKTNRFMSLLWDAAGIRNSQPTGSNCLTLPLQTVRLWRGCKLSKLGCAGLGLAQNVENYWQNVCDCVCVSMKKNEGPMVLTHPLRTSRIKDPVYACMHQCSAYEASFGTNQDMNNCWCTEDLVGHLCMCVCVCVCVCKREREREQGQIIFRVLAYFLVCVFVYCSNL